MCQWEFDEKGTFYSQLYGENGWPCLFGKQFGDLKTS